MPSILYHDVETMIPNEYMSIRHPGMIDADEKELPSSPENDEWAGGGGGN